MPFRFDNKLNFFLEQSYWNVVCKHHPLFNSEMKAMNISNVGLQAALLSERLGTNFANELRLHSAFVSRVPQQIPFVFVGFKAFAALMHHRI